jgi:hypothetical protein
MLSQIKLDYQVRVYCSKLLFAPAGGDRRAQFTDGKGANSLFPLRHGVDLPICGFTSGLRSRLDRSWLPKPH